MKGILKAIVSTLTVIGVIAGAIVAVFGVLDVTGITQNQLEHVLTLPENVNELIEKRIAALDKWLAE